MAACAGVGNFRGSEVMGLIDRQADLLGEAFFLAGCVY